MGGAKQAVLHMYVVHSSTFSPPTLESVRAAAGVRVAAVVTATAVKRAFVVVPRLLRRPVSSGLALEVPELVPEDGVLPLQARGHLLHLLLSLTGLFNLN